MFTLFSCIFLLVMGMACSNFSSNLRDINSVYSARDWLWSAFVYTAMVNYPTKANFMMPLPAYPVEEVWLILKPVYMWFNQKFNSKGSIILINHIFWMQMCKIIDRFPHGATNVSRAFAAASLYYNYSGTEKCFDLENGKDAHGLHGWDWQVLISVSFITIQTTPFGGIYWLRTNQI